MRLSKQVLQAARCDASVFMQELCMSLTDPVLSCEAFILMAQLASEFYAAPSPVLK